MNHTKSYSANPVYEICNNQSAKNIRLYEHEHGEKRATAEILKENAEMKEKIEKLTTENRTLLREMGKKEGMQEILERNFANIDVRAQQLEREVGQLLGDLKHEQSKVEEVRSELNAVTQQNAELLAELEQLRNNVTLYNDEKLSLQTSNNQDYFVFDADNELEEEEQESEEPKILDDVQPITKIEHQNYMEFEMENISSDHNFTPQPTPTQSLRRQTYVEVARFSNVQFWHEWMTEPGQNTWTKHQEYGSTVHQVEYFKCKYWRRLRDKRKRGGNCYALLKVLINKQTGEVIVLQSFDHVGHGNGTVIRKKKWGLTERDKEIMREVMQHHKSPVQMHEALLREHNVRLDRKQVVNFFYREKRNSAVDIAQYSQKPKVIQKNSNKVSAAIS